MRDLNLDGEVAISLVGSGGAGQGEGGVRGKGAGVEGTGE